jgi:branched-chain amino acid transport system ATP-binding protein
MWSRSIRGPGALPRRRRLRSFPVRESVWKFGGIVALERVSFAIRGGEMLGLIGPNGAGKTTLFNCFSRLYTPKEGDIVLEGRSILALPPHRMAGIGIGRTFQNLALFRTMSVLDNVRVGSHSLGGSDFLSNRCGFPGSAARSGG